MPKKILLFLSTIACYLISYNVFANKNDLDILTSVHLGFINVQKPAEIKDQLYLHITEYSNMSKAKEYRIPTYPKHWLHNDLSKLKNITLWKGTVKDLEHKELIISLVEYEELPLENDKPLGSVKLVLSNHNGNLKSIWDKTSFKEPIKIKKISEKSGTHNVIFKMLGKNSDYTISFYLKIN